MPVVVATGLEFAYGSSPPALSGVDLSIEAGEFVGVAGPNGGGKTTLVRLIVGLEQPTRGRIEVFGEQPQRLHRRHRIGYLPQRAQTSLDAPIAVEELVAAGRAAVRGPFGPLNAEDKAAVGAAIERVGLTDRSRVPLSTLSGGQQQRAFIAKALAGEPELLVLDEPTAGVDADAQASLARLLDELRRELHVTILYVSHEFAAIEPYVERLILVHGGIAFDGPPMALPQRWHDPSHVHL
jgi:zinc transport system ATP-binding protein